MDTAGHRFNKALTKNGQVTYKAVA